MRSHCMSHGFRRAYGNPEWAASPTALAEKPWVSEATRELLRTAPADALAPTPVPPLGPASGDWSAEQKAVASDAGETWADVMERANAARNQRRWGGGASELGHSDGWANLPSDVSFGGGGVGGGGGGGSAAAVAAVVVVEAVAGSRKVPGKLRVHPVAALAYPSRACADEHGHGLASKCTANEVSGRQPLQAPTESQRFRRRLIRRRRGSTRSSSRRAARSPARAAPRARRQSPRVAAAQVVAELAVLGVEVNRGGRATTVERNSDASKFTSWVTRTASVVTPPSRRTAAGVGRTLISPFCAPQFQRSNSSSMF